MAGLQGLSSGPSRAVIVLCITQILGWGALFYPPGLTMPHIAAAHGWSLAQSLLGSRAFYASLWERRGRIRDVDSHVLWGLKDSAFQPHVLESWKGAVPHARVVTFDDAGHWPHEETPDAYARALAAIVG